VEYRVEQHKARLGVRLEALLAAPFGAITGTAGLDV
jgi:hypothetical protein